MTDYQAHDNTSIPFWELRYFFVTKDGRDDFVVKRAKPATTKASKDLEPKSLKLAPEAGFQSLYKRKTSHPSAQSAPSLRGRGHHF
jgi:hypothetical protein